MQLAKENMKKSSVISRIKPIDVKYTII